MTLIFSAGLFVSCDNKQRMMENFAQALEEEFPKRSYRVDADNDCIFEHIRGGDYTASAFYGGFDFKSIGKDKWSVSFLCRPIGRDDDTCYAYECVLIKQGENFYIENLSSPVRVQL